MDLATIALTVFKATLEQNTPDSAPYRAITAFPGNPTVFRTFGDFVHASVPPPFVSIEWYAGGLDNDAKTEAGRSLWKVTGYTREDEALSAALRKAIYLALHKKWGVVPVDAHYNCYNPIRLKYPYSDTIWRSAVAYQRSGGIYELCIAETKV